MSKQVQAVLQNAWRKAYKDGELRIKVAKPELVHKMRFMLYTEAKRIKKMERGFDPELERAIEECMITLIGCGKCELRIIHRKMDDSILDLADQLGIDIEMAEVSDPISNAARESAQRLKEALEKDTLKEAAALPEDIQARLRKYRGED